MKNILLIILLFYSFTIFSKSKNIKDTTFTYHIPNAFTPNGDGVNDTFGPVVINSEQYTFIVIDRYNNIIFSSNDGSYWNGMINNKFATEGVYVWKLNIMNKSGKSYTFYGHFSLL